MNALTPLWLDRPRATHPPLAGETTYDVVVVGGGLTGLLSGLLLARSGKSVAVLEARQVGDGTTGRTTAKVSLLQGTRLSRVLRTNPPSVARDYVTANQEGLAWLRRFCEDHEVPFQVRPAYTYATTRHGELRAQAELTAAQAAGLDVTWETETELPYAVRGAVRLADQLQLHPMDLLDAAVAELVAEGGTLCEQSRVLEVHRTGDGVRVTTDGGSATARAVVLATNQPILRRHGMFAKVKAERSYCAALTSAWVPHGMYLSSDSTVRSLRSLPVAGGEELLLVGGSGHGTGRTASPRKRLDQLLEWARGTFPGSSVTHTWSAQDQVPATGLPYVGPMLPRDHTIWVATGFAKWGFTNAPAAALLLSKSILSQTMGGEPPSWGRALSSWTPREVASSGRALFYNAEVGAFLAEGLARPLRGGDAPAEGEGVVRYDGPWPVAVSKVDGVERKVSAVCPHLKGIVRWNDAERSWDCPLHGSRFAPDGTVLDGPTICGLKQVD